MNQIDKIIIVSREDFIDEVQAKHPSQISLFHLKGLPNTRPLIEADYIFFKDENGQLTVMKDRYPIL